jgi:hypothetical protein
MFSNFFKKQTAIQRLNENTHKDVKHAIFNDDVRKAFIDFIRLNSVSDCMLIGGVAVGVHSTARNTQDVDIIVLSENDIDKIFLDIKSKFSHPRPHSFEHKSTGVEIKVLTPAFINYPKEIVDAAMKDAEIHDVDGHKIKVVSAKFLVVLKLKRANANITKSHMDKFDITNLSEIYGKFDLSDLNLPKEELKLYDELTKNLK